MKDTAYSQFVDRWKEVTDLPPQRVGPMTPVYKKITMHLKVMPWPVLVAGGVVFAVGLYVIFGSAITFLVSILQRGF